MERIRLKDTLRESRLFGARLVVMAGIIAVLMGLLVLRLAWLQLVSYKHYSTLAQVNRINPVPIPSPRGLILDRRGVVLAQNYPVLTIEVIPDQVDDMNALLEEIGKTVRLTERDLKLFRKQLRDRPRFEALMLRTQLTEEEAARFAVIRHRLNGADLHARLQRHYPQGGLGVHAIGYVGRISEEDEKTLDKASYRGLLHIGKLGVEQSYEGTLIGTVGVEKVETNAHGRALRSLERIAPIAGRHLHLHLDARLQAVAEQALGHNKGAVVAMDPKTGGVLVFASTPTYDPNPFVNGIDTDAYAALRDNTDIPLLNRALNGRYPPGSTIKAFFGLAALESGEPPTKPVICPGWFSLPGDSHKFRCWKKDGHGSVALHDAVVQSCDVYFYRLAVNLGIDRMQSFLASFGFGSRTGVDLKGESDGLLPSPAWKQARGQPWFPGETVVTGIGQGPVLFTPLQLATAFSAMANHGQRPVPRLAATLEDPVTRVRYELPRAALPPVLPYKDEHLAMMLANLTDVVHGQGGTARGIGWNAPYKIAGKTGTAQVKSVAQGAAYVESATAKHLRDHALFIALAPVEDPKIVVAVIVENGGHGGSAAAPIARRVMDEYLLGHAVAGVPAPVAAESGD
jgi:penicillin-binding protein 2